MDAAIQSKEKKAVAMTEYEHMEMNPISLARGWTLFSFPLSLSVS